MWLFQATLAVNEVKSTTKFKSSKDPQKQRETKHSHRKPMKSLGKMTNIKLQTNKNLKNNYEKFRKKQSHEGPD